MEAELTAGKRLAKDGKLIEWKNLCGAGWISPYYRCKCGSDLDVSRRSDLRSTMMHDDASMDD